jgi:hypothetical protein
MRIWLAVVFVAGCWNSSSPGSDTIANRAASRPGMFTITASGFGPIDGKTVATLANLRTLFLGQDVKAVWDPGLEMHIYSGTEQLAFVVLNEDMSVFNVHATSGKIAVSDRAWRVGEPFHGSADLTQCECWGDNPTCFRRGEHVAVNFKRACDGVTSGDKRALKVLDGVVVQRVIWSPNAFGADAKDADSYGGDDYGGDGGDPCGGP